METNIADTFRNGTVLVTGSTGFLGKVLTEKLLRSCPVKNVAIMVRSKKGHNAHQRLADIYKQSLFDRLRKEKPDFMSYIKVIEGDLEESSLGSFTDREWLIENVNFVFHCAATVKFNEPIELATKINIQGTENVLTLAAQMKNLKGFVHVSTAYSHCPNVGIEEKFYSVPITAKELKNVIGSEDLTPDVSENWPNTYTFTKAITEDLISKNDHNLPISIFRPSIIGCTKSEPEPGWLENYNGPTGMVAPIIVGFLRTFPIDTSKITDIIPVDYTVNALISIMWDTVNRYQDCNAINDEPKIYNYVSSAESPLLWDTFIRQMHDHYLENPPLQSMWYIFYVFYTNLWVGVILRFCLHRIPAAFMDCLLILNRKSPKMLRLYSKTEHIIDTLYEFTTREWKFDNSNTRNLWLSLSQNDRNIFYYSLDNFDWKSYIKVYFFGIRKHVLREDLSNLEKASSKNRKLFWLHYLAIILIIYFILQMSWTFMSYSF